MVTLPGSTSPGKRYMRYIRYRWRRRGGRRGLGELTVREFHPAANIFPLMRGREFNDLLREEVA